jgi:hypothetical protein
MALKPLEKRNKVGVPSSDESGDAASPNGNGYYPVLYSLSIGKFETLACCVNNLGAIFLNRFHTYAKTRENCVT